MTLGRNDERYRLPHRLLRSVTEHPLGPLVPIGNDPIQVLADNGVVRRFDNRSQSAGPQFRGVMLGDVPENQHHAGQLAAGVANGSCAIEDGPFGTIFRDQNSVVGQADDNTLLKHFVDWNLDGLAA